MFPRERRMIRREIRMLRRERRLIRGVRRMFQRERRMIRRVRKMFLRERGVFPGKGELDGGSSFNQLRVDRQLCDALLRVGEEEFPAHKIILCRCSPFFRALFIDWSTPDCKVFDIRDLSAHIMSLIIEFAYTGYTPVTKDNVQELFVAADRLIITGITDACSSFMVKEMAPANCISIWRFTDTYYYPELKHKALLYILHHFEEMVAVSEGFLHLSAEELVNIIQDDRLRVQKEMFVFEAILHWINFALEERGELMSILLSNVRLARISPQDVMDKVANNEMVTSCYVSRMIVLESLRLMLNLREENFPQSCFWNPLARPRLPSGILLAIGGWNGGRPTNAIEAFDFRTNLWVNINNYDEVPRAYYGTVFLDGSVYCVGGCDGFLQFSTVNRFDLETHSWHEVAPMHSRRCYVCVTLLDGYIYALGGFDGETRLETAERYLPSTNQWTLISSMNEQRSDAGCTTFNGKVYICGGFNGNECLSTAECYDPETNEWTMIPEMNSRRSGVGVITYADRVFAVGGFNGSRRLNSVEEYNPSTDTWQNIAVMLRPRSNFGISVMDDCLFVVGGFSGFNTMVDVEYYDRRTAEWSDIRDLEVSRSALSCCVVHGLNNMADYTIFRYTPLVSKEVGEKA